MSRGRKVSQAEASQALAALMAAFTYMLGRIEPDACQQDAEAAISATTAALILTAYFNGARL